MKLELVSHNLCPYVQRAVIVLLEKGIAHERTYIDLADKPDWFLKISPLGKVPLLIREETVLFESQVIAEYLDEVTPGSLFPEDPLEKARHKSWIEYGSATLNAIGAFYNAKGAEALEDKRLALRAGFEQIEAEISGPYFDGEEFHLIDGVWGTIFRYLDSFDEIADFGLLEGLPKTQAWRLLLAEHPSVRAAAPEGYSENLKTFLIKRQSALSALIAA